MTYVEVILDIRRTHAKKTTRWQMAKASALILILAGISGVIFFSLNLNKPQALELPPTNPLPAPIVQPAPKALSASQPVRLHIAKINVDANFVTVGHKADGTLQTPNGPWDVGWYQYSPTPGELGPAVVVGHVDWIDNIAIFWRLRELQPGDTVQIDRADGSTVTFKVDSVKQFDQANFPTQEVYGNINYAGIRLITCGGTFNTQTRHYSDNTVVFGSLVI